MSVGSGGGSVGSGAGWVVGVVPTVGCVVGVGGCGLWCEPRGGVVVRVGVAGCVAPGAGFVPVVGCEPPTTGT